MYMPQEKPIDHHYVPRFYLKGFVDSSNKLYTFDRYHKQYKTKSPASIAFAPHYYTVDTVDEKDSTVVEDGYGKVENAAKPILDKLLQRHELSKEERENFALFIAMQYQRVPDAQKRIAEATEKGYREIYKRFASIIATNDQAYQSTQRKLKELKGAESSLTPEHWARFASGEDFQMEVDIPREYVVKEMLEMALHFAPYIYKMNWTVLYAPKGRAFITSDNPFTIVGKSGIFGSAPGLITPGSRKLFPLSKDACLVLGDEPKPTLQFELASTKGVRHINYCVALNSDRYIMAPVEALTRRVVKVTKIDTFVTRSRVKVS